MYTLVIADDEMFEQKALQKMLRESCPEIRVLPGVSDGLELVACMERDQPDIVVLDINMPVLNGLDALEILRLKKCEAKILLVTAYSKFEYAQRAMSFGAENYLLKPVNEAMFIQSVKKICAGLDKERHHKESQDSGLLLDYRERLEQELISDILLGDVSMDSIQRYQELVHLPFWGAYAVTVKAEGISEEMARDSYRNILHEIKRVSTCFGKVYRGFLAVCLFPAEGEGGQGKIEEIMSCVRDKLGTVEWDKIAVGVGNWKYTFEELIDSMRESQIALRGSSGGAFCFYEERRIVSSYKKELEECQVLLAQKHLTEFCAAVERLFVRAYENDMPLQFLHTVAWRMISEAQEDSCFYHKEVWNCWPEIQGLSTAAELCNYLKEWGRTREEKTDQAQAENPHIREAVNFMLGHYMEDLSLEMTAERTRISSFYLSRLFKQEFRRTFLEVLTDIRFSKGMELLYCTKKTVQQISQETGYGNVSYFYRLFKKKMGMTAGEMKEYLQNL